MERGKVFRVLATVVDVTNGYRTMRQIGRFAVEAHTEAEAIDAAMNVLRSAVGDRHEETRYEIHVSCVDLADCVLDA